jgi:hypothetical protein
MNGAEYKSCMGQNMGGGRLKGLTKEQRAIEFCSIAKECSKGISHEEAVKICSIPKPPKPPKPEGEKKHRRKKEEEQPQCDSTMFIEQCVAKLPGMIRSGELPENTDVPGLCQLILG